MWWLVISFTPLFFCFNTESCSNKKIPKLSLKEIDWSVV